MSGRVQRYTQEFKDSAIQLALNSEKSAIVIAKELGMSEEKRGQATFYSTFLP